MRHVASVYAVGTEETQGQVVRRLVRLEGRVKVLAALEQQGNGRECVYGIGVIATVQELPELHDAVLVPQGHVEVTGRALQRGQVDVVHHRVWVVQSERAFRYCYGLALEAKSIFDLECLPDNVWQRFGVIRLALFLFGLLFGSVACEFDPVVMHERGKERVALGRFGMHKTVYLLVEADALEQQLCPDFAFASRKRHTACVKRFLHERALGRGQLDDRAQAHNVFGNEGRGALRLGRWHGHRALVLPGRARGRRRFGCRGRLKGIVAHGELDAHLETEGAQHLGLAQVCFEVQGRQLEAEAAADIGTKLVDQSSRRQRRPGRRRRRRRGLRLRLEFGAQQTVGKVRDARRRIRALDTAQVCAQAVFG